MVFHKSTPRPLVLLLALVAASALVLAGCGDDDDPTDPGGNNNGGEDFMVTADMQGVWNFTTTYTDCDGNPINNPAFQDYSYTDTLCLSDAGVNDLVDDANCTQTSTGSNSFTMNCSYNESIPGVDCNVSGTTNLDFSWTNNSMSASGTIDITATGSECSDFGQVSACVLMTTVGTRTGDAPAGACGGKSSRFDVAGKIIDRLHR